MPIAQYIYTSTCTDQMTLEKAELIAVKSVSVCRSLGLTGRVFSSMTTALAITEGPADMVSHYYEAVTRDPLVATIFLHVQRPVPVREFDDYSVWLDFDVQTQANTGVFRMDAQSLVRAMPSIPSSRLRVVMEAYFHEGRLVA